MLTALIFGQLVEQNQTFHFLTLGFREIGGFSHSFSTVSPLSLDSQFRKILLKKSAQ